MCTVQRITFAQIDFWFGHMMPLHRYYLTHVIVVVFFFSSFSSTLSLNSIMLSNHPTNRIVLLMGMFRCDVQTCYDVVSMLSLLICLSQLAGQEKGKYTNYVVDVKSRDFCFFFFERRSRVPIAHFPSEWIFNTTLLYAIFNALFFGHITNVLHLICFESGISIH